MVLRLLLATKVKVALERNAPNKSDGVKLSSWSQLLTTGSASYTISGTHSLLGRPGLLMYQSVRGTNELCAKVAFRRGCSGLLRKIFPKSCS